MSTEKRYYLAAGEVEQKVRKFFEDREEVIRKTRVIADKVGGHPVTAGPLMVGVHFPGEPPAGWKYIGRAADGGAYYKPQRRSKAGKELHAEISAIRIPGAVELHGRLAPMPSLTFGSSGRIFWITAEISGGQVIVHVPESLDYEPPGCRLLKNSEYWEIKEKQESKAA